MRRALSRPAIYLAVVSSLWFIQLVDSFTVAARTALEVITLPWNLVLFYALGIFGVNLSALMSDEQSGVLLVASALIQAALLSYLGARVDRKRGPAASSRAFVIALICSLAPAVLMGGSIAIGSLREHQLAARSGPPAWERLPKSERQRMAAAALAMLLRAEFEWVTSHPGGGYNLALSGAAGLDSPAAARAIAAAGYAVKLSRRDGFFGPAKSFSAIVTPQESAPYAYGFYADESGVIREARVRESVSAQSPPSHWPLQFGLAGFTRDDSAIIARVGVRVLYVDARTGSVRKSVNLPFDFVEVVLDSAARARMQTVAGVDSVGHMIAARTAGELWTVNALGESGDFTQWESAPGRGDHPENRASRFPWREPGVIATALSRNGKTVATMSSSGVLKTWDFDRGSAQAKWDLAHPRAER
jgi:hypothetical protein